MLSPETESPRRITNQRRIIVGIIETANRHLDAAQILSESAERGIPTSAAQSATTCTLPASAAAK